jgi:hypothetical protein
MFFQIARETILLLLNNIHEKIMQSLLKTPITVFFLKLFIYFCWKLLYILSQSESLNIVAEICTVFQFFALYFIFWHCMYFENIAQLLANQN